MYGNDERDLLATLSQMHKTAVERAHWNQNEAKEIMRRFIQVDRRFDAFDPDRLIERISEARSSGRTMDLADGAAVKKDRAVGDDHRDHARPTACLGSSSGHQ